MPRTPFKEKDRGREIAKLIIDNAHEIDKDVDNTLSKGFHSVYALPFSWDIKLLLTRSFAKLSGMPRLFRTFYDFYMLYFPKAGIIRSVRYMGSQDIPADTVHLIKKLKTQRDDRSDIGNELTGCFVSHGQIETKEDIDYRSLFSEYFYMNLIKPLSLIYKDYAAILPTPLSTLSILIRDKQRFLIPCNITLIVDYTKAKEEKGYILGENMSYIETEGHVIGCLYNENSEKPIKCKPAGPFKVAIPKIDQVDDSLYEGYFGERKIVVTNIAGIVVLNDDYVLENNQSSIENGYILPLYESPFNMDVSAFIHLGESVNFEGENFNLKTLKMRISRESFEKLQNKAFNTIDYCCRSFNAEYKIIDYKKFLEDELIDWVDKDKNEEYIYLYSPTLADISITEDINLKKMLDIITEVSENDFPFFNRDKHNTWLKIIRSDDFFKIFHKAFNIQRNMAKKYKLNNLL